MTAQHIDILRKYNYWGNEPIDEGYARPTYLKKLTDLIGNTLVKVVLGQRRSGKSHLMRALISELIKSNKIPAKNILYINKELYDFNFIKNADDLMAVITLYRETIKPKDKFYIFLDEIQEIELRQSACQAPKLAKAWRRFRD